MTGFETPPSGSPAGRAGRIAATARRRVELEEEAGRLLRREQAFSMRRRARLFLVTAVGLVAAGAGAALFLEEGSFLFVAALELVLVLAFNAVLFVFIGRRTRIQRLLIETVLECESGGRRAQTGNGAAAPTGASSSSADHTTS